MTLIYRGSLNASKEKLNEAAKSTTLNYMEFVQENVAVLKTGDKYKLSANPSGILPDSIWNQFSSQAQSFVLELINIHDTYTSLFQLERRINIFVDGVERSNIILDEKIALYGGAYTALYSNIYWDEHSDDWDLQINKESIFKFRGWRDHVKADIGGGIVGAFMGARAGAIGGAAAGGVGGGIAGACGASAASIVMSWF